MRVRKVIKALWLPILFSASLFLQSCASTNADGVAPNTEIVFQEKSEKGDKTLFTNGSVNFKGVSFSYNPLVFGEVEAEELSQQPLENETDKPDSVYPQRIHFSFNNLKQDLESSISVFSLEDYRGMYAVSTNATEMFDENLKDVRMILKNKSHRTIRDKEVPFLPYADATQVVKTRVKHFTFGSGTGFFFLTQYNQDINLINNKELVYIFQGISEDGKKYILARFSVSAPFLPDSIYEDKFEGYKTPERGFIKTDQELRQFKNYISKITKRLENLPPDQFEPNLKYIEEIISSLKVEK